MESKRAESCERLIRTVLLALMLVSVYFIIQGGSRLAASQSIVEEKPEENPCVVIDAGHGGADPGKVGVDGSLEKDINLKIVQKLQKFLEMEDVQVFLTRESDAGLYDENASNKKVQDMKNRVALIEEKKPDLVVSIHQNSYHEEYVHGAQTFYYAGSEKSKELAERIQRIMTMELDEDNTRQAKANDSYYLLKKTSYPIVIVECGFLSNYEEAQKLSTDLYQEKTAWAIHLGVMQYLSVQSR
jgi:N-acetylmuramoyl-L-alanine amidase